MPQQSAPQSVSSDQLGLDPSRLPRHVAIIMDGNGRWAGERDLPRAEGHRRGAEIVRDIVSECGDLGIEVLTLFSFSIENWKRPADEVAALMSLLVAHLIREREDLVRRNVRLVHVGRRQGIPQPVLDELDKAVQQTAQCTGLTLALALNYGSRTEIVDAVQAIAESVRSGAIDPKDIDEQTISDHLYTANLPDPDLLVRTSGEMRISNYLLWQISYAELYVTDVYWPDFDKTELHNALRAYASRDRRFGAIDRQDG